MNDLQELWQQRYRQLIHFMTRYGRLIINDHFSVIALVLLGFMSFVYKNQLENLQQAHLQAVKFPVTLILSVWLTIILSIGRPIYFTEQADASYLYPQGNHWRTFWLKGFRLGLVMPLSLVVVGTFLTFPFLAIVTGWTNHIQWVFLLGLVLLKVLEFAFRYLAIFNRVKLQEFFNQPGLVSGLYLLVIGGAIWLGSFPGILLLLLILGGLMVASFLLTFRNQGTFINFDYVIAEETKRVASLYKFVAIFADVKTMQPSIKRRQYLDGWLRLLQPLSDNRYGYLYVRAMFRHNAYSGVWFKVMIFVSVLLSMSSHLYVLVGISVMGFLLTATQLIPLLNYQNHNPYQKLYPLQDQQLQQAAFKKILTVILTIQGIVYALISYSQSGSLQMLWIIVGGIIFPYLYVPLWSRKHLK